MSGKKNMNEPKPLALERGADSVQRPCWAITLTVEEIADLAKFCGLCLKEEPDAEEKQAEITIQSWPEKGVRDDDGATMLPPHKCIAYYEDYPEEGCVPLGSPNDRTERQPPGRAHDGTKTI